MSMLRQFTRLSASIKQCRPSGGVASWRSYDDWRGRKCLLLATAPSKSSIRGLLCSAAVNAHSDTQVGLILASITYSNSEQQHRTAPASNKSKQPRLQYQQCSVYSSRLCRSNSEAMPPSIANRTAFGSQIGTTAPVAADVLLAAFFLSFW